MTTMSITPFYERIAGMALPDNADILRTGDRLSQKEFHRRYQLMPEYVRAELIRGIVYMSSPVRATHGGPHFRMIGLLAAYEAATPGVLGENDTTVVLGEQSEPQPDVHLRLAPECGGRVRESAKGYLIGPPEFVVEVAHSSEAIDLHAKRLDYVDARVLEYVVLCIREARMRVFDTASDQEVSLDKDGVFRSEAFPGLWIDPAAVFAGERRRMFHVLQQGLASPKHAAFAKKLATKLAGTKRRASTPK